MAVTNTTVWIEWSASTANTTQILNSQTSNAATGTSVTWQAWNWNVSPAVLTPEETERRRAEVAERNRLAAEARGRARKLLTDVLDDAQRAELERDGYFHVQTRDGERVYRLAPGTAPVRVKGEDGQRWSYCIHPRESYPAEDTAAALKLMIEADEAEFLRIANATHLGALPAEPVAA